MRYSNIKPVGRFQFKVEFWERVGATTTLTSSNVRPDYMSAMESARTWSDWVYQDGELVAA